LDCTPLSAFLTFSWAASHPAQACSSLALKEAADHQDAKSVATVQIDGGVAWMALNRPERAMP